jgi:PAS domain-containing protein
LDEQGNVMGHLAVLDNKPMPRQPRLISLFEIFAARAAAEHRRLKIEQEVRAREEQLSLLLQSALDAILVLDGRLSIVRVNPAAERLFGCSAEDLVGRASGLSGDSGAVENSLANSSAGPRETALGATGLRRPAVGPLHLSGGSHLVAIPAAQ